MPTQLSYGLDTAFFFLLLLGLDAPPDAAAPPPPPLSLGSLELGCTVGGLALLALLCAWVMVMVSVW